MSEARMPGTGAEHSSDSTAVKRAKRSAGVEPAREQVVTERRRASRSLWAACETLLSANGTRAMNRALQSLQRAFGCDGVALHALAPSGDIEPWSSTGAWKTDVGDLRDCMSVPLFRGDERVGTLDLMAKAGERWRPAQLTLIRTAAGALGASLGARLELERLRNQPGRDAVTGLPDEKAFAERLEEELARARRHGMAVGIAAIEPDHFDGLRSRYGDEVADQVLAEAALFLKLALRESDIVGRYGRDGFAVLLPETDTLPALRAADRARRALEGHRFARVGRISVSAGVAASPRDGMENVELIESATRALSLAKKSWRRRVVAATAEPTH